MNERKLLHVEGSDSRAIYGLDYVKIEAFTIIIAGFYALHPLGYRFSSKEALDSPTNNGKDDTETCHFHKSCQSGR